MTTSRVGVIARRAAFTCALAVVGACVTEGGLRDAINAVNKEFQTAYEAILRERGTQIYPVKRADAFVALHAALSRLRMRPIDADPLVGTLKFEAPAPLPLDVDEWRRAADADLPRMRAIAREHVGIAAHFISFEPEGLVIVINATVLAVAKGSEISLTMRMREVAPPKSGMPRREYPPPTAVREGLNKIWNQLDKELRAPRVMP